MSAASPVDILLKVTVVLALAPLAARALSRRSAAARHQVWALALGASLLMPVLTAVAPRWTIAVLPAPPVVDSVAMPSSPAAPARSEVFEPIPSIDPGASIDREPEAASTAMPLAASVWLGGVLLVLARFAFGTVHVWWIGRQATPNPSWAPLGRRLAGSLAINRDVRFVAGRDDAMPMAWGLLRAHVLLPAEAERWPRDRQRVVLLHELAHVKRRDSLTQMLAHLACAAYWFHPLVWLAARRLRAEREHACDDLVLAAGTRGSDYADHLLDIARSLRSAAWPTWSAVTMAHRSQLEGRLMAILDPALPRRSPTRRAVAVFATVTIVAILSLAGGRAVARAADEGEQGRPTALISPAPTPAPTPMPAPTPAPIAAPTPAPMPAPAPAPAPPAPEAPVAAPPAPFEQPPAPPAPPASPDTPSPLVIITPPAPPAAAAPGSASLLTVDALAEHLGIDLDHASHIGAGTLPFEFQQVPQPAQPPQPPRQVRPAAADPKITAALTSALKDENEDVRRQALQALVRMRAPLPADVIAGMLKDKSPDMRRQAVFALGQQRDPKNAALLGEALKDSEADVRRQAAFALGQLRDARAVDPLMTALKDSDPDVRKQAAFALGQIRDARAVDALIALLKDPNADVRQQAVFALGQIR